MYTGIHIVLIDATAADVFQLMEQPEHSKKKLEVRASYFEIYLGKVTATDKLSLSLSLSHTHTHTNTYCTCSMLQHLSLCVCVCLFCVCVCVGL